MCHSWLITAHIPLGHLECHWKSFNRQMDRTHQLLQSLSQHPSTPTQLLTMLQLEPTNINDTYISYKPIIIPAINLLDSDPSFNGNLNYNKCVKRSLLPFLGNALSWLTGTATSKDVNPYHAKGYSWLVANHTKCNYSRNQNKCSTMPSMTIVA